MEFGLRNLRPLGRDWNAQFEAARALGCAWLQVDGIPEEAEPTVQDLIAESSVRIYSITCLNLYLLGPDQEKRNDRIRRVRSTIEQARRFAAPCVSVFAGKDPTRSLDENLETFAETFGPLAAHAEEHGVTLVMENCPMGDGIMGVRNLAFSPELWERMFALVPSKSLGLELDTGHLPKIGIDPARAVEAAGSRIGHVGMKDVFISQTEVQRRSTLANSGEFRLVGEGMIDFRSVIAALQAAGYQGPLTLDHISPELDSVENYQRAAAHLRAICAELGC